MIGTKVFGVEDSLVLGALLDVHDEVDDIDGLYVARGSEAKGGVCLGIDFHGRFVVLVERTGDHEVLIGSQSEVL